MPQKRQTGRRVVPDDASTSADQKHPEEAPQPPPTQPAFINETVEATDPAQPISEPAPPAKRKPGRPRKNAAAPAPQPPGEAAGASQAPATLVATGDQEASPPSEEPRPKKRGRKKAGGEDPTIATAKPANETEDVSAALATGEKPKRKPGRPRKVEQQQAEGSTQVEATTRVEEDKPKRKPGRPRKADLNPMTESKPELATAAQEAPQPSGVETAPAEKPRKKIGRPRKNELPVSEPPGPQQQQEHHDTSQDVPLDESTQASRSGQNPSDSQSKMEEEPQPPVASTTAPMSTTTTTTAPVEAVTTSVEKGRRKPGRPRKTELAQESTTVAADVPQETAGESGETAQRGRKRAHSQSEGDSQVPADATPSVDAPPAKTRRRPGRPKKSEVQGAEEPAADGSQSKEEMSVDGGTVSEKPKRARKPFDLHSMPPPKPQTDSAKSASQEQPSTSVSQDEQQEESEQVEKPRRGRKKRQPQTVSTDEQGVEGAESSSKDVDTNAPRDVKKRGRPRKQPEAPPPTTAQKRRADEDEEQAADQSSKPAESNDKEAASPPQKKNKSEHISGAEDDMTTDAAHDEGVQDVDPRQEQLEAIRARRAAAALANRDEVFAEHQRAKTSPRMQVRHERKRAEAEKILEREQIEKTGGDYERHRSWTYTAEEAEQWEEQQDIKAKRAETGFTDYNQMAQKKYERQLREFKPDLQAYEEQKRAVMEDPSKADGEESFYRDANSLAFSVDSKPSNEAVDRLVADVQKQEDRRERYSRAKTVNEEDDITYINERNRRFNDKIDRFYGKHTKEIRENFERGTAL